MDTKTTIAGAVMSTRLKNVCKVLKIKTIGELIEYDTQDLLKERNVGRATIAEIAKIREAVKASPTDALADSIERLVASHVRDYNADAWRYARYDTPTPIDEYSRDVIASNGIDTFIAKYSRNNGWVRGRENVEVKFWMNIPKLPI